MDSILQMDSKLQMLRDLHHKLVPIELSKNEHETTIDLLIYKNHYVLIN